MDDVHHPRIFTDAVLAVLRAEVAQKNQRSQQVDWTRELNPDFNLLGLLGEHFYGELTGQERRRGFGDGGEDFPGVDVKAVAYFNDPILKVEKVRTTYYALVAVDMPSRHIRYCGYATGPMIEASPIKDFGRGVQSHALAEHDLLKGLPPAARSQAA
jgi:hypothetical protein